MSKISVRLSVASEWTVVPLWNKAISPTLSWTIVPLWNKVISPVLSYPVKLAGLKVKNEAKNQLQLAARESANWAQSQQASDLLKNAKSLLETHVIKPLKKQADPRISELLETLKSLQEKLEGSLDEEDEDQAVFFEDCTEEKEQSLRQLDEFLSHPEDPVVQNLGENRRELEELCALLRERDDVNLQNLTLSISHSIGILEGEKSNQTGWLAKFTIQEVLDLLGLRPSKHRRSPLSAQGEKAERAVLARMNNQPIEIDTPENFDEAVGKKLDEITNLAIKIGLIRLIFNGKWKEHFSRIYKEAESKTTEDVNFDTAFLKAVEDEFSTSEKDQFVVNRARYWFHLNITLPILKFYAYGVMRQFKADLLAFLKRTPEERINDVFTLALMPLKAHMSAFYTFNESLASKPLQGTVDESNRAYFDNLKSDKGETIDSTLLQFTHMIIERYAPAISWTQGIESSLNRFEEKMHSVIPITEWTPFKKIMTAGKVTIVWTSFILTGAPEWIVNKAVKYGIKRQVKGLIKLNLFKTDSSEQKTHSRYQYFINRFITEKLRQFNASGNIKASAPPEPPSSPYKLLRSPSKLRPSLPKPRSSPSKLRSSPSTQKQMQDVISELFQNIPLSIATSTAPALNTYFRGQPLEQGKQTLYNLFVDQFAPTVSLEILKGLEHFLYDDKAEGKELGLLSEFVWFTINNLENTLTKESDVAEQAEMNATEAAMHEQLQMAVATLVKEGVKTALDPSKKYENQTNAITQDVKRQSEAFLELMDNQVVENFTNLYKNWKNLNDSILKMTKQFKDTKIKKIVDYGDRLITSFQRDTKGLDSIIKDLEKIQEKKRSLEDQLAIFEGIQKQIQEADPRRKIHKLTILREKKWVSKKLKSEINRYEEYLHDFLKTPHSVQVAQLEQHKAQEFQNQLEQEKVEILATIREETGKMTQRVVDLQEQRMHLINWNRRLIDKEVNSKDVSTPLAKLFDTLPLEGKVHDVAVSAVMQCVGELLNFKEKPYHWNQVLIRALRAGTTLLKR